MSEPDSDLRSRASQILKKSPLIDGHNDFPFILRGFCANRLTTTPIHQLPVGQTDIARLCQGRLGGQFWSAFVSCPTKDDDFEDNVYLDALRQTMQQIDLIHSMISTYRDTFALVNSSQDILPIFESGRVASLIGIEGLHQIANSPATLRMFHRLGVRYVSLAHNSNTRYGDAATSISKPHQGLSGHGRAIVLEMNRVGIIVDLSHSSVETARQTLAVSRAPVMFSHSSWYLAETRPLQSDTLSSHPRNVPDDVLDLLKDNNGLIMICFLKELVKKPGESIATIHDVVDHILYAGRRIGFQHVGIGSDFDGMLEGPEGLDEVSHFPALVEVLLQQGLADEEVKQVLGLNVIRVLAQVEEVASTLQAQNTPVLYDKVEKLWTDDQYRMMVDQGKLRRRKPNLNNDVQTVSST